MKIIHTYQNTDNGGPLTRNTFYYMTLSALLAKRHYGTVVLYTNNEIAEMVRKIGIPYDEINTELLNEVRVKTFSIPKMHVYANQNEPYIHIDLDTFIFKPIEFDDNKLLYSTYAEGNGDILNFETTNTVFYNTYVKRTFEIQNKLPKGFLKYVKFNKIPNMSVFGGQNFDLIKKATEFCLKIYNNNPSLFDNNYYNACVIEQLFIPSAMRLVLDNQNDDIFKFLFKSNPSYVDFAEGKDWEYPFTIRSQDESLLITDNEILFKYPMYDFNGFLHLNGYKTLEELVFLLRQRIIEDFDGAKYIKMINEFFPKKTKSDKLLVLYHRRLKYFSDNVGSLLSGGKLKNNEYLL